MMSPPRGYNNIVGLQRTGRYRSRRCANAYVARRRKNMIISCPGDDRILVQKNGAASGQYALERATADTRFREGRLVRISVEAPREYDN
jgi:hypothetical protein